MYTHMYTYHIIYMLCLYEWGGPSYPWPVGMNWQTVGCICGLAEE